MTDGEIVEDVRKGIVALTKLDSTNESFGAKMVKWASVRMESKASNASRSNGALGGRPRLNAGASPQHSIPPPKDRGEVFDFAAIHGIPDGHAIDWYEQNVHRDWKDKDGNRISNWMGALVNYSKAQSKKKKP